MLQKAYKHLLKHKLIDSAMVIGFVTAFSYLLTYIYETTYMDYFGAGSESARVELVPVITTSFIVFGAIILATGILIWIAKLTQGDAAWKQFARTGLLLVFMVVLVLAPLFYTQSPEHFQSYLLRELLRIFSFALKFALLLIAITLIILIINKVIKPRERVFHDYFEKQNDKQLSLTFLAPLLVIMIAFEYPMATAIAYAYGKTAFKVINDNGTNLLVLREYSNHMVCMKYDQKTNKLMPAYTYVNYAEEKSITYSVTNKKPIFKSQYLEHLRQQSKQGIL